MGGDLQPGRLADRLVAGLSQPEINSYGKYRGYIVVPTYEGSLAEAEKEVPANKPDPSLSALEDRKA
eukprot:1149559-Pelagomonas_calceolata.AAC.2